MFIPGVTLLVNVANFGVHSAAKMRGAHILMKIVSFGTRPDEAPYLTEWSERTGIELKQITATLNEDNVDQAAGYDGITCMQTVPYSAALFQKMADLGIKFLSIRNVAWTILIWPAPKLLACASATCRRTRQKPLLSLP